MIKQEIEAIVYPGIGGFARVIVPESWIGENVLVQLLPRELKNKTCNNCGVRTSIEVWEENGGVCKSCNDHLELEGY